MANEPSLSTSPRNSLELKPGRRVLFAVGGSVVLAVIVLLMWLAWPH